MGPRGHIPPIIWLFLTAVGWVLVPTLMCAHAQLNPIATRVRTNQKKIMGGWYGPQRPHPPKNLAIFDHWGLGSGPSPDVRTCLAESNRHPGENQPKKDYGTVVWALEATTHQKFGYFRLLRGGFWS